MGNDYKQGYFNTDYIPNSPHDLVARGYEQYSISSRKCKEYGTVEFIRAFVDHESFIANANDFYPEFNVGGLYWKPLPNMKDVTPEIKLLGE